MAIISANAIRSLVQGVQFKDPQLYDVLMAIVGRLQATSADLSQIQAQLAEAVTEISSATVPPVTIFQYTLIPDYIQLTWVSPGESISNYEIRKGTDWDTALRILVTNTLSAVLDPLAIGDHTYLIKSIDSNGVYTDTVKSLVITIPPIGAVSITHDVIDNNVLLYWEEPVSAFRIVHYIIKRNGTEIGFKDGTFTTVFEQIAGTNTYSVIAVDLAGNQGTESFREVAVSQPPDYVLQGVADADYSGSATDVLAETTRLLACVDPTETWETHFTNGSYDTIQDIIDDGYPYFLEPCQVSGEYIEVLDFGEIFTSVIVTVDWTTEVIDDSVTISPSIDVSDDNSTWAGYVSGSSLFSDSVRYVRIKLSFAGSDTGLIELYNLAARIDVKQITDSGTVGAVSTDAGGTTVTFNKAFKDVNSITVSVNSTAYRIVIYDFTDVPNPTTFKVLVFDSAGNRTSNTVAWIARGVA